MTPVVKNLPANEEEVRNAGWIPRWGRSPGGGHDSPCQYSCLENSRDRGAWQAIVHGVAESDTSEHACMPERPTGMQEWKIVKEKKKRY